MNQELFRSVILDSLLFFHTKVVKNKEATVEVLRIEKKHPKALTLYLHKSTK